MTLDRLRLGQPAKIQSVGGAGSLRLRLLDMGLTPGTVITIQKAAPMGDPLELSLRGYTLSIRLEDARNIQVEVVR